MREKIVKSPYRHIMGKNSIMELLRNAPERIVEVFVAKGVESRDPLIIKLRQNNIPVRECSKQQLFHLVQSDSHQSFVASVKESRSRSFKQFCGEFAAKTEGLVVLLDSIFDPQNFGAILRACECFGVDGVVWSKNRGTDITPVVSKASVGATELLELFGVSNLAEAQRELSEAGFEIVACEARESSTPLPEFKFSAKTALIFGSEGKGIQKLLADRSNAHVKIPMFGRIDSLNVSQAAAVILFSVKA